MFPQKTLKHSQASAECVAAHELKEPLLRAWIRCDNRDEIGPGRGLVNQSQEKIRKMEGSVQMEIEMRLIV
jgi:hypothetical protein